MGNIYGTAQAGGFNNSGTVFILSPSSGGWTETTIHSFDFFVDGGPPNGNLVLDRNGNLIGTTQAGSRPGCGGEGCGVCIQTDSVGLGRDHPARIFPELGITQFGGLIADAVGNLYGTTGTGGPNGGGMVYELSPSNRTYTYQVLYNFTGIPDQFGPVGILAIDSSGNLYGATEDQGVFGLGNIFKLTHNSGQWTYSDLHDFNGNGAYPKDGPTVDASGNLYGTAYGANDGCNPCVVWEITPSN